MACSRSFYRTLLLATGTQLDLLECRKSDVDAEIREKIGGSLGLGKPVMQELLATSKLVKGSPAPGERDHVLRDFVMRGKADLAQNEVRSSESDDFLAIGGDRFVGLRRTGQSAEVSDGGMNSLMNKGIRESTCAIVLEQIEPDQRRGSGKNQRQPKSVVPARHVLGENGVGADRHADIGELCQHTLETRVVDPIEFAQRLRDVHVLVNVLISRREIAFPRLRLIEWSVTGRCFTSVGGIAALCHLTSSCFVELLLRSVTGRLGPAESCETVGQMRVSDPLDLNSELLERLFRRHERSHGYAVDGVDGNEEQAVVDHHNINRKRRSN